MLPVTSIAAAALAALFAGLTVNVIRQRGRERVLIGSGSEPLARAIRAQGNFAETVPLVLILSGLAEANGTPWPLLVAVAVAFGAGRIAHAYSLLVGEPRGSFTGRVAGMMTTFFALAVLSAALLVALV